MLDIEYLHVPKKSVTSSLFRMVYLTIMFPAIEQAKFMNGRAIKKKIKTYNSNADMEVQWQRARRELQIDPNHISSFFCDRFSAHNKFVRMHAATAHALKFLYEYDEVVARNDFASFTEKIVSNFWLLGSSNSMAIKNRKKCIEQLLVDSFDKLVKCDNELSILSVASGSAEAVVGALQIFCGKHPDVSVKVLLVDIDRSALKLAKDVFAQQLPMVDFKIQVGNVFQLDRIDKVIKKFNPNLIEKAGFLDYITNEDAPSILQQLQAYDPGIFITCNIVPNIEQSFLHDILMWEPMIYRTPEIFKKIMIQGNFNNPEIYVEPYNIHAVGRYVRSGL